MFVLRPNFLVKTLVWGLHNRDLWHFYPKWKKPKWICSSFCCLQNKYSYPPLRRIVLGKLQKFEHFHTSKILSPIHLYLIFEKSSLKNQVQQTELLTCINQFWNWFLQATEAAKIQFVQLDFSKIKYRWIGHLLKKGV